jgi:DNA-binding PadR family transcriptional regulator
VIDDQRLPATSYAILGMLSMAPMSGYELLTNVGKTIANFWTISKSQAYSELARLEDLALVSGKEVAQDSAPDKRIYRLTEDGGEVLDAWLGEAAFDETRTRSHVLLKVFFAYRMPPAVFLEMLDRYRTEAAQTRDHLKQIVEMLDGMPETFYSRATALLGVRSAEAALSWVDEVTRSIPERRAKAVPPEVVEVAAREYLATTPARPQRKKRRQRA